MKKCKEEIVVYKMARFICKEYNAVALMVELEGEGFIMINNDIFTLLLTVCETGNGKKCIKLEEARVKEEYRGKGVYTVLLQDLKMITKIENVKLGLWCEKTNNRLFKYYQNVGFVHTDTLRDYWLEYN